MGSGRIRFGVAFFWMASALYRAALSSNISITWRVCS